MPSHTSFATNLPPLRPVNELENVQMRKFGET